LLQRKGSIKSWVRKEYFDTDTNQVRVIHTVTFHDNDSVNSKIDLGFDINGNEDGKIEEIFNRNGQLVSSVQTYYKTNSIKKLNIEYEDELYPVLKEEFLNEKLLIRTKYEYTKDYTVKIIVEKDGQNLGSIDEYYPNNYRKSITAIDGKGRKGEHVYYYYDTENRLLKQITKDSSGNILSMYILNRDKRGNVIES
jgi:hypothetical protein